MSAAAVRRLGAVLAAVWAGVLLCIGAIAAPSAFATLAVADAGRFVGRMFAQEAYLSLGVALVLLVIERQRSRDAAGTGSVMSANILLLFGTLFCTVAGYFAVLPFMEAARAGHGTVSFLALHAISGGLFALKGLLALVLAWRLSARSGPGMAPLTTVATTS